MPLHDLSLEVLGVLLEEKLDYDHHNKQNVDVEQSVSHYYETNHELLVHDMDVFIEGFLSSHWKICQPVIVETNEVNKYSN